MPRDQDLRAQHGTYHLPSKARARQQPLLLCLAVSSSGALKSRKQSQYGHSTYIHTLPASKTQLTWIHAGHRILYIALRARGRSLHRSSSAEKVCDFSKQLCCNTVSSGLDRSNTLRPYAVSEIGCQSCQSATINLSHKAIEYGSKHSS